LKEVPYAGGQRTRRAEAWYLYLEHLDQIDATALLKLLLGDCIDRCCGLETGAPTEPAARNYDIAAVDWFNRCFGLCFSLGSGWPNPLRQGRKWQSTGSQQRDRKRFHYYP
jgi:hypothetical protein